jgi:hypothetical protein
MNLQHQISPIPGVSNEELERFAAVIAAKVLPLMEGDEVFNREQAAAFLKYGVVSFDKISAGLGHIVIPGGDKRYLKSELIEFVKRSKVS